MSRIIFNRLYTKIQETLQEIDKEVYSEKERDTLQDDLRKLKFIFKDLYEASYLKKVTARERLRYYIDSGFSYEQTSEKFGISLEATYACIGHYSKKAIEYMGTDAIQLIKENKVSQGFVASNSSKSETYLKSLVLDDFIELLPKKKDNPDLKISDCGDELALLKIMSYHYVTKQLNTKNTEKLSFLLYVLISNNDLYKTERGLLFKYLEGNFVSPDNKEREIQLNELMQYFKNINV